jgi:small-conductance mechanosensitive channel
MQKTQFGGLLSDLWLDLQRPAVLWQVAVLALCLGLAWLVARAVRRTTGEVQEAQFGRRGLKRLAFPLAALVFVLIARPLLQQWHSVNLLRLAVPLLGSFAVIRAMMFALRYGFPRAAWLASFERVLALVVWSVVALYLVGLLPEIVESLDAIHFTVGKQRLSLWLILQGTVIVLATLLVALWLGGLAEQRLMDAAGLDGNLKLVFARLARAGLVLLAVLISLPLVGIDLTALSVFGGALGVGIGFGLQKIAASYVSGFILLLDRSIRLGNMITVDKYNGEVTRITTRYTVLRAPTGVEAIVPNEVLVGSVVLNETYTNSRVRHAVAVQVGYGCDLERAMALMVEAAHDQERVLAVPPPKAFLVRFADSGIELELGFWIEDPEAGIIGIKSDINLAIWRAFRREGIEIPYPQREVRLSNPSSLGQS